MQDKVKELIKKGEGVLVELKQCLEAVTKTAKISESARFKKLSDGWILDKALGIEWGPTTSSRMNWDLAKKHAAEQGGRLPTVQELRSLVDYERHEPAINTDFFGDTKNDWYWTSTETAWNKDAAWCVDFDGGSVDGFGKGNVGFVRPVRASQSLII